MSSALPTSFHFPREQVDRNRAAARVLLEQSSVYHRLLIDLPL